MILAMLNEAWVAMWANRMRTILTMLGMVIGVGAVIMMLAGPQLLPFGWQALWQPFEYFLYWRNEPIYKTIGELNPVDFSVYGSIWLPAFLVVLVLLMLWRWRRHGLDAAQLALLLVFIPQALGTQRFLGYLSVLVAPFLARDLDDVCESLLTPLLRAPWLRAAVVAVAIAVKVESPGPVFFRQTRVGKNGRHFKMLKFRSMQVDAEERLESLRALRASQQAESTAAEVAS